jgi:hypothetical protein
LTSGTTSGNTVTWGCEGANPGALSRRGFKKGNKKLLPQLHTVLADVRKTTNCRLIRARGLARLSAWFAFGHTFSEVAGYTVEVQQQQELWRTDRPGAGRKADRTVELNDVELANLLALTKPVVK